MYQNVCRFVDYTSKITEANFIEIDAHLGSAVNCQKITTRKWLYYRFTPTVYQLSEGRAETMLAPAKVNRAAQCSTIPISNHFELTMDR